MYDNQEVDGVIAQPGLLPEGTDESIKKEFDTIRDRCLRHTDPEFNKKIPTRRRLLLKILGLHMNLQSKQENFQGTKI